MAALPVQALLADSAKKAHSSQSVLPVAVAATISLGSIPSFHGAGPSFSRALTPQPLESFGVDDFTLADPQKIAALAFALAVLVLTAILYRSHGRKLQFVLIAYITSLFSTQLAVKAAVTRFPFPMFVTALHFASTWLATVIFYGLGFGQRQALLARAAEASGRSKWFIYLSQLCPPAIALCGSVMLNNAALMYIGISLNALIGIAAPLATACLAAALGTHIVPLAWLGIFVAACGDAVAAFNGFRAELALPHAASAAVVALGIGLSCGAMLLRATKAVLQGRLMSRGLGSSSTGGAGARAVPQLDPMQLVSLQSPILTLVAVLLMVAVEGIAGVSALSTITSGAAFLVALSCAAATSMNFAGMCAISMLGAPASQLAGKLNIFVTAALSSAFFGDVLTPGEVCGGMVALLGLAIYEKAQKRAQKKASKEIASLPYRKCSDVAESEITPLPDPAAIRPSLPSEAVSRNAAVFATGQPATPKSGSASPSAIVSNAIRTRMGMSRRTGVGSSDYAPQVV